MSDDLPPSMYDGNDFDNFDYDGHYNEEVFGGKYDADTGDFIPFEEIVEALNDWLNGASGWTLGEWVDSIKEIDVWYDEDGDLHFDFDFDYDGAYGGSRSG